MPNLVLEIVIIHVNSTINSANGAAFEFQNGTKAEWLDAVRQLIINY